MKLTILGCMGAYPSETTATSSYLLESGTYQLVIDFGSGAYMALSKITDPLRVDAIVFTHYHHDHYSDFGVLQYAHQLQPVFEKEKFEGVKKKELVAYGHTLSNEFQSLTMPNISTGIGYQADDTLHLGPFKITFLKTIHPVPCFALRIEEKETKKVFVFTADSGYLADFITFAQHADLLLADGMLLNGNEHHHAHMTSAEVAKIAELGQVKRVVLTHLPATNHDVLLQQAQEISTIPITLAKAFDCYTI